MPTSETQKLNKAHDSPFTKSLMLYQIPEAEYSGSALTEGACLFRTPETIRLDRAVEWDCYEDDGLGPVRIALFRTGEGVWFSLQHHEMSPRRDLTTLFVEPTDIAGHVDSALVALGCTSADLAWLPPSVLLTPVRLIRQDDNGVQFAIGDFPCRADAEAVIARLAAGGHKQAYFTETIRDGGPQLQFPDDYRSPPTTTPS